MFDDQASGIAIRRAAMNCLARREHTQKELQQKLQQKFPQAQETIVSVIHQLTDESLQSDQRFAESFVRWKIARGCGPVRIQMELAEKGIASEQISAVLAQADINWELCIVDLYQRKFGDVLPSTMNEKAKIHRFLMSRGFSSSQVNVLWKHLQQQLKI